MPTTTDAVSPARTSASTPARTPRNPTPHTCKCGAAWAGSRTAHCAAQCHRTFSGVSTFDLHRRGGACLDPAEIGLTLVPGRPYECWGTADSGEEAGTDGE